MTHSIDENNDPFPQLGTVYRKVSGGSLVKQLTEKNAAGASVISAQNRKIAANGWGGQSFTPNAWGCPRLMHKLGMHCNGNSRKILNADSKDLSSCGNELSSQQNKFVEQGCNAVALQVGSVQLDDGEQRKEKDQNLPRNGVGFASYDKTKTAEMYDDNDNDDVQVVFGSSDDEDPFDDDSDIDASEKSSQTFKTSKWFKSFFDDLDKLNAEELNSQARKWHCPACKRGPGAIDWYRGLEPLMYHALTRMTRRAKLHRMFAELLDEETQKRGVSVVPLGVAVGRWHGLNERVRDYEIVWPPMVVIMNTRYEQEENGKWIGMGNQELLDHFKSYAALKARHSYGPQGHRGMSVLIFDDSTAGYLEAARLYKHFKEQGRDREAWKSNRFPFCSGGKRQLYGYMASKEDLDFFNQHSQGRSKLKFEMRSYQEMVEKQIKQINKNNQLLVKCKDKMAKAQKRSQVLAELVGRLSEELRKTTEENHSTEQQTEFLLEQKKDEMNSQEKSSMDQVKCTHLATDANEDKCEKLQRATRENVEQPNANIFSSESAQRTQNIGGMISQQDNETHELESEKKKLIKTHEDKKATIIKRCLDELNQLEEDFKNELGQLMNKYNSRLT